VERGTNGEILFDNDSEEMLMFKTAAEAYEHIEVLKRNGDLKDEFITDVEVIIWFTIATIKLLQDWGEGKKTVRKLWDETHEALKECKGKEQPTY